MPTDTTLWRHRLQHLQQGHLYLREHFPTRQQLPPLLLLHGIGDDGDGLATWSQPLHQQYHCIIPDLRGHGWSSRQSDYSLAGYIEDIKTVLTSLDQPAHIYGHSLGGLVALALTQTHSHASLILEDPPLFHLHHSIQDRPHLMDGFSALYHQRRDASDHSYLLAQMAADEPHRPLADVARRCRKRMACDPEVWRAALDNQLQPTPPLAAITCPTTLLCGNPEKGGVIAAGDELILKRICSRLHIHQFPESGHTPRHAAMPQVLAHLGILD